MFFTKLMLLSLTVMSLSFTNINKENESLNAPEIHPVEVDFNTATEFDDIPSLLKVIDQYVGQPVKVSGLVMSWYWENLDVNTTEYSIVLQDMNTGDSIVAKYDNLNIHQITPNVNKMATIRGKVLNAYSSKVPGGYYLQLQTYAEDENDVTYSPVPKTLELEDLKDLQRATYVNLVNITGANIEKISEVGGKNFTYEFSMTNLNNYTYSITYTDHLDFTSGISLGYQDLAGYINKKLQNSNNQPVSLIGCVGDNNLIQGNNFLTPRQVHIYSNNHGQFIKTLDFNNAPQEDTCQDKFYHARDLFLSLSKEEQGYILNTSITHDCVKERYLAWAKALGEDYASNAKLNSSNELFNLGDDGMSAVIILSSVCLISLLGALVIYKKRKLEQ